MRRCLSLSIVSHGLTCPWLFLKNPLLSSFLCPLPSSPLCALFITGETPYDLVPRCDQIGKGCRCAASFTDAHCSSYRARKTLLSNTEAPAPLLFSGLLAGLVVTFVVGLVSLHLGLRRSVMEQFTPAEWGGIGLSFIMLWGVLAVSSFVR